MKSGFKRRRRTEFDSGPSAIRRNHFAGAGTGGQDESSDPDIDSHRMSSENSGSLDPGRFSVMASAVPMQQFSSTNRGTYGFAGGSGDAVNTS